MISTLIHDHDLNPWPPSPYPWSRAYYDLTPVVLIVNILEDDPWNHMESPLSIFLKIKLLFMASGMVLTPLPEVYTLFGEGGGIRTRVS
jgi:hypothetical protein